VRRLLLLIVLIAGPAAGQEPGLDVAGHVEASGSALDVRVDLTNRGGVAVDQLVVEGELFGRTDDARREQQIPPQEQGSVLLRFPLEIPVPGTHALTLRLDYRTADAAHTPMRQRAYLLLTLGAAAAPVVTLAVAETQLQARADVEATLSSSDGAPHTVKLRLLTPRGLNPTEDGVSVEVPAHGEVRSRLPVLRANAPRGSRQGVLVVAETTHDGLLRTTVATGVVQIANDPAWMPRLRVPLAALAGILLAAALGIEAWRTWAARAV
jgi:hypothetical protein